MRPPLALLGLVSLGLACSDPCECPLGTVCGPDGTCEPECITDADCYAPVCAPEDPCCTTAVECVASRCVVPEVTEAQCGPPPEVADGWDAPPGEGLAFVVNRFAISDRPMVDVDGRCDEGGCLDNALAGLAALGNDQLRQALLGGESLLGIEIAGLDEGYAGFDRSVTVKIYALRDADDPFFPANNFATPPGHDSCCQFIVHDSSLDTQGEARARLPAQIRDGRLFSVGQPSPVELTFTVGLPPHPRLELFLPQMQANLPRDFSELDDVVLSGALSTRSLGLVENPYCRVASPRCPDGPVEESTLLDLATWLGGQPDIDVDGDGVECLYDQDGDGRLETCCPGAGDLACQPTACAFPLPAPDPEAPASCSEELDDGHSISFRITARPATFVDRPPE